MFIAKPIAIPCLPPPPIDELITLTLISVAFFVTMTGAETIYPLLPSSLNIFVPTPLIAGVVAIPPPTGGKFINKSQTPWLVVYIIPSSKFVVSPSAKITE